jgi:hypothetical protein
VTKTDVVKQWKPELKALGFAFRERLFLYERPEPGHLELGVSVQRNTGSDTYKIGPSILLRNPLREGSPLELVLLGTLRADGIFLHVTRESWWPPEALGDALRALRQHLIGWYRRVGRIDYLTAAAETAIARVEDLVQVLEPMDAAVTALPWAPDAPRRLGRAFFYRAAVLHHLNGDRARALGRTRDWLQAIPDREAAERARAQAQLAALGRD